MTPDTEKGLLKIDEDSSKFRALDILLYSKYTVDHKSE